ncbi:MAG TPA: DUF4349 domain-containing protein [Solirubrobacterales bacterium]|nr:DUF4349 domain-containing protein [Solirubrobacterales bacterium]
METPRNRDDQLAAELRALRPTPRPEFTAELDERAAAGFPRRSRLPRPFSKDAPVIWSAMRSKGPARPWRRLLIPAGGVAVLAIAVSTAVIATNDHEEERTGGGSLLSLTAPSSEESAPPATAAPEHLAKEAAGAGAGNAAGAGGASEASSAAGATNLNFDGSGDYVRGSAHLANRAVERSATLVLGAKPADVGEDSAKVFEAVHAHDGIVMRSSTQEGEPGQAGATFELLIPSAKLGDALAALSAIDEVRSRHEATADITAPTVNVTELLRDSKARIDSLLGQLEGAETESEREAVEAELRQERRHRARLRSQLQNLQRRADYSRVLVQIETGAKEESGTGGGTWGVDDALGDAGHILAVAAAVTVVGLAIIGPIALIALLAWLTHRAWVRRERRRVLS